MAVAPGDIIYLVKGLWFYNADGTYRHKDRAFAVAVGSGTARNNVYLLEITTKKPNPNRTQYVPLRAADVAVPPGRETFSARYGPYQPRKCWVKIRSAMTLMTEDPPSGDVLVCAQISANCYQTVVARFQVQVAMT